MREPAVGVKWVECLSTSEDGELLGICLAIDLEAESVTPSQIALVLDGVSKNKDARAGFYAAVQHHEPTVRCASRHLADPADFEAVYVRIMELGDFITYYLKEPYGYNTEPADVETVRKLFLRAEGRTLGDINPPWSGKHQIVWVVSRRDILGDGPPRVLGDDAAANLADILGLGMKGGVGPGNSLEIVMVVYPPDFEMTFATRCRQPTAFDANWETAGTLYMSEGRGNAWGLTRSCSGRPDGLPERVHPELARIDRSFVLYPLGVTIPPKVDRTRMNDQAYDRLENITKLNSKEP